jgi:hypothetical protein
MLSESLHRQLSSYALAASASGVGLLALTQPAEGKILYTPAHVKIGEQTVFLDLNHDGQTDFSFRHFGTCTSACKGWTFVLSVYPVGTSNKKWGGESHYVVKFASALQEGVQIGPQGKMYTGPDWMAWFQYGSHNDGRGPWANVKRRYLGLEFVAKDGYHYGWARLNIGYTSAAGEATGTLTGYAYETIPNKPIVSGRTHGSDVIELEPGSLGVLAVGASKRQSVEK